MVTIRMTTAALTGLGHVGFHFRSRGRFLLSLCNLNIVPLKVGLGRESQPHGS